MSTQELTDESQNFGFLMRAFFALLKVAVLLTALVVGSFYVQKGYYASKEWGLTLYGRAIQAVTRTEVVREYIRPTDVPLESLIANVARENRIPVIVLRAIIEQESASAKRLYRFEPRKYEELRSKVKDSDDEIRMLASSHGPAHVMGFNAMPRCGIHWSQLYDTYTGLNCGAKILRENLDKVSSKDAAARLTAAVKAYNGSGPDADEYAQEVMGRVGKLFVNELMKETL